MTEVTCFLPTAVVAGGSGPSGVASSSNPTVTVVSPPEPPSPPATDSRVGVAAPAQLSATGGEDDESSTTNAGTCCPQQGRSATTRRSLWIALDGVVRIRESFSLSLSFNTVLFNLLAQIKEYEIIQNVSWNPQICMGRPTHCYKINVLLGVVAR